MMVCVCHVCSLLAIVQLHSWFSQSQKPPVADLFQDFCDGKSLLALLESLSGVALVSCQLVYYDDYLLHFPTTVTYYIIVLLASVLDSLHPSVIVSLLAGVS